MPSSSRYVQDDPGAIDDLIDAYPFATMVHSDGADVEVIQLPIVREYDLEDRATGRLVGHMARANPIIERFETSSDGRVLVLFHGPHASISPYWYRDGPAVPTWNYLAVQVRGTLQLVSKAEPLRKILDGTLRSLEGLGLNEPETPWESRSFQNALLGGIVGFTIDVKIRRGIWKLSQNHAVERRQRVVEALRDRNALHDLEIAHQMAGDDRPN